MRTGLHLRSLLAAIALGASWCFILVRAFEYSGYVTVPMTYVMRSFGVSSPDQIHVLNRIVGSVVWSTALGLVCGLPFGLLIPQHTFRYWVIFVGTALLVSLAFFGAEGFFAAWNIPEAWVYPLGVLPFAYLASRIAARRTGQQVAP